ncbi:MAG: hypothetical protein FKY71_17090 [Spiribacter salinus]|uniref:Uncharacterized protein n=1 Tax=Spiribacter salinus TaxID=1335746 RepID=A0A540VFW7_9GAMM|nr:MAG: hypothetical protein FKY71_17090 [Spiribacter salinus]
MGEDNQAGNDEERRQYGHPLDHVENCGSPERVQHPDRASDQRNPGGARFIVAEAAPQFEQQPDQQ